MWAVYASLGLLMAVALVNIYVGVMRSPKKGGAAGATYGPYEFCIGAVTLAMSGYGLFALVVR